MTLRRFYCHIHWLRRPPRTGTGERGVRRRTTTAASPASSASSSAAGTVSPTTSTKAGTTMARRPPTSAGTRIRWTTFQRVYRQYCAAAEQRAYQELDKIAA